VVPNLVRIGSEAVRWLPSRATAAPVWAWVGAIVVLSSLVRFALARHMVAPWIMIDEIVYSELAKSFADTGHFAIRDVATSGYGDVYPVLISPAYVLFGSMPTVYTAIKAVNAVLISVSAIPAYLLARRVVSQRSSLVVAVLTVSVPSAFYAGTIMTENAFYPIFLFAALALVHTLERPSWRSVALFVLAALLAYETRAQAVVLVAAALTAPLVLAAMSRRPGLVLRYRWLYGILVGGGALVVLAEVARGRSLRSLLGAYAAATDSSYSAGSVAKWLLWHVAELDLYTGVLPVLALVVLLGRSRRLVTEERVFLAAALPLVGWLALEVAAFASQQSSRIEERNLFYVAPLLFVALALWIERGLPRPRAGIAVGAAIAAGLVATIPYQHFIGISSESDTLAMLPLWSLSNWLTIPLEQIRWVVLGGAAVFVIVGIAIPRRAALVLPMLLLVLYAAAGQPIDARTQSASIGALFQGVTSPDRDWITRAVGSSDPRLVAVVWSGATDRLTVNENEFFNRDVGPIFTLAGPLPDNLAQTPVTLLRRTGYYVDARDRRIKVRDVLTDTSVPLAGVPIARDARKGLVLLRVDGDLRTAYRVDGVYPGDTWTGAEFTYTRFACRGGVLTTTLRSDGRLFADAQIVRAYENGLAVGQIGVPPDRDTAFRVHLNPRRSGECVVRFRVALTRVPAEVQRSSTDTRPLGIHVLGFTVAGHA